MSEFGLWLKEKKELADLTLSTGEKWVGELSNRDLKELFSIKAIQESVRD